MTDGRLFTPRNMSDLSLQDFHRAIASDVLRRYPLPLPDAQVQFSARTTAVLRRANGQETPRPFVAQAFQFYLAVAVLALVANLVFRRGLIRMMGLELVTADGRPASRLRVLFRTAITWSPILVMPLVMRFGTRIPPDLDGQPWWMLGMIAGAIVIAIWPTHGVQDRLAGTWVVPR